MILQDLAGILLSYVSFFASDFFRLAWRNYKQLHSPAENGNVSNSAGITGSLKNITRVGQQSYGNNQGYGTIPSQGTSTRFRIWRAFRNSLWTSVTLLLAAMPLGIVAVALLFADLNTANVCSEWIEHKHFQVGTEVMRWKLFGDLVEDLGLFFWFPSTMIILFGWKEFKTNYLVILLVCFSSGCIQIIYKLILFIYNPYVEKEYYFHLCGNACFFASILCSSYIIAVKVRKNGGFSVPPPKILVVATLCAQFTFAFVIGLTARYFIIPTFTQLESQFLKAIYAAITPVVTILPVAMCRQLALLSNVFTSSRNNFILAYFVYGATVIIYRVMQADVKNIWLFIGLSVLHGLVNVVGKATERFRYKLWTRIFRVLKMLRCCRQMEQQVHSSPYNQRLSADKEIQTMLYDYAAMILSQTYLTLYVITNYDTSAEDVLQECVKRIAIGLGIDMFFNTFSILVRDYMYNSPVRKVWKEHWKVHLNANAITTAMTIWFFSPILLTVVRQKDSNYILKNCTAPIHY